MKNLEADEKLKMLIEQAKKLGFAVRKESGTFESSFCNLNNKKIILINKDDDDESIIKLFVENFLELDLNDVYLMPAVRDYIENYKSKE
ncbi:MAG: hypothetical protein KGZ71_00785 [Desulfobulbaceae bacterium]|nr:hypothetical protein [Candidatus Kapabacteria bacterium]MBS3998995.1 hypothetical protein [Desulfobulbaceae bacterium]